MENAGPFIKADNNLIINENCIRWVRKMDKCLEVCLKTTGCRWENVTNEGVSINNNKDTHKICKEISLESYERLNKYFQ